MLLTELDFDYPERLVATERAPKSRVLWVQGGEPSEITTDDLLKRFAPGDTLVINNTRVLKRRVFSESGLEILFLKSSDEKEWEVLCPSTRWKPNTEQVLPQGVKLEIIERGRPQKVRASQPLTDSYFEAVGEMPLPPYIQKARGERHNRGADSASYQTQWAKYDGSLAAPTASLHFNTSELTQLIERNIKVVEVTLHVGLGTFLPITVNNLEQHLMHEEIAEIRKDVWQAIQETQGKVWALGTTVARTLESAASGKLHANALGDLQGATDLFIRPGFEYQVVDVLMTNFHQPRSTLFALVSAFSNLETVRRAYAWAIEREFRLFSYGDLSVWTK
jgi:S-adenosylmethionine:tRNA ribosyltransferase-isomerase